MFEGWGNEIYYSVRGIRFNGTWWFRHSILRSIVLFQTSILRYLPLYSGNAVYMALITACMVPYLLLTLVQSNAPFPEFILPVDSLTVICTSCPFLMPQLLLYFSYSGFILLLICLLIITKFISVSFLLSSQMADT